ncbi:MAG: adenylyltransferase/cytidyltransferase family protein [Phycisphaerales bacterium]|nr:adenylyltransferase/cytidyltransferase family protein [Phycisphaerales bacterium]
MSEFLSRIIFDRHELQRESAQLRAEGKQIVFANGAFDLLHVGHIRFLRGAAAEGDVLIVGVNTDESIRRYKGPDRPVQPLEERIELVGSLKPVTIITAFDEPTADAILEIVRPHVHAKGPDYTLDNLPEGPTLKRLGIRLATVGDPKNHSTSDLIARIVKSKVPKYETP